MLFHVLMQLLKGKIFYFFQISYTIFVIEQLPGKPFNRAKLFNIGFQEAKVSRKESTTL